MEFDHYTDMSVRSAADLVNSKGSVSGTEYLGTIAEADRFLKEHNFVTRRPAAGDVAEIQAVRERLKEVFHAPDESAAAELLNVLIEELEVQPHLTDHDGAWHVHYAPAEASIARQVGTTIAMGLASVVSHHGFERLGVCAADNCSDAYVDTSRNRSRRYCSDACSTRMNVAAYRARNQK